VRRAYTFGWRRRSASAHEGESQMSKGRDRPAKETKKPKSDKNKKHKHMPFGGKTPSPVMATMHPEEKKQQ
jgi:hypothetical protein